MVRTSYDMNNFFDKTFIDKETMLTFSGLEFHQ